MKNATRSLNSKVHSLGDILEASMKFEARAKRLNEREAEKMERIQRSIVRNQRVSDNLRSRVMARTEASLKNISGFQKVLSKDYTVKKFKTMEKGFNQRYRLRPVSPRTARQLKLETRAYYSGLDRRWFQPEIERKMRQQDPTKVQKILQKVLKEDCEGRNQLLDRYLSEDAFQQEVYNRLNNKADIKIARFHYTSNNKN
ncbi:hypothetical protein KP79_PYT21611 [Mizuhopecten yessoensis]|uniref:Uncharacterized protein n=1 Tax=Mizuhopecten yessoensis TaxID=6573 RepID=A0A210QXF6_MIZYE|nr:hypothetical protein KP79_PYT21611 [Mizuhopecten yessoensis]